MTDTCATCRFFVPTAQSTGPGICRRYPQGIKVAQNYWCGEYGDALTQHESAGYCFEAPPNMKEIIESWLNAPRQPTPIVAKPKRKPGRPKGSKNKKRRPNARVEGANR